MSRGTFDIAMPPRSVPPSVRLSLLFGGALSQIGWGMVAFGGIFAWIFAANADLSSLYYFRGEIRTVAGTVTGVEKTAFSTGGSSARRSSARSRDGNPIYEVRYRYTPTADISHEGKSYFTHTSAVTEPTVNPEIVVEYPADRPDISRIEGMRRKPFHAGLSLIALIPIVGLLMALRGLYCGMINVGVLTRGRPALGKMVNKRATGARVNNRQVWALTFAYQDDNGQMNEMVVKTHHVEQLMDDALEKLLYDPGRPSRAVLLDSLPGTPGLDEMGNLRPVTSGTAVTRVILPAIGIGLMAVIAIQMMR